MTRLRPPRTILTTPAAHWWIARRITRLAVTGHRKIGLALDAIERVERISQAFEELAAATLPERPRPHRRRLARLSFVAVALTILNAAAVVLMLTLPDETSAEPDETQIGIAVLLGLLLAGCELTLAISLGRKLNAERLTNPPGLQSRQLLPDSNIPSEAAALGLLCALLSALIYSWTQIRIGGAHPRLATALGVCLAIQAWIAPWLLVTDLAATRSSQRRERVMLTHRLEQLARARESERLTASLAQLAARSALQRVEHGIIRAVEVGHMAPHASWSQHIHSLTEEIAVAHTRYQDLTVSQDREIWPQGGSWVRGHPRGHDPDLA